MTNGFDELTAEQERALLDCYRALHRVADGCTVPAVVGGVRGALAELHAVLEGQALVFELYSHRWTAAGAGPAEAPQALAG